MRHIIFEAILAREFTSSSCVSLSELYSAATILELNSKQSHGVHSFPSVVVRGPDFSGAAYQPVIFISRFVGHDSTCLAVSLVRRFKDSPSQEIEDTCHFASGVKLQESTHVHLSILTIVLRTLFSGMNTDGT